MRPSVASRLRRSRPAIIGFSVLALVVLTVSYAFAATLATYTFDTTVQGWTGTATMAWNPGFEPCPSGGCIGSTAITQAFAATSPSFSLASYGNGTFTVTFIEVAGGAPFAVPTVSLNGGTAVSASGCTANGQTCSATFNLPASPSATSSVVISMPSQSNVTYVLDTITLSAQPAGGVMSFPALDLGAVSTQMGGFFSFIAPALWVAIGISLGGYIAAKVRGIL